MKRARFEPAGSRIPKPADWVTNPTRQLPWSQSTQEAKIGADDESLRSTYKLADCMKYMNIELRVYLNEVWYMNTLYAEARAAGVNVVISTDLTPRAVVISRTLPREVVGDPTRMMKLSEGRSNSLRSLYILSPADRDEFPGPRGLTEHMAIIKEILGGQITLIIFDPDKYYKKAKPAHDLEMAMTDLLVTLEINTVVVKSPEEIVSLVLQYTKAVAEEPAKLAKRAVDEQADFYMRGDNKHCVTVDQQGNGLARLWQQMLGVLPQSSLEVSRAIAADYSSPRLLAEAVSSDAGVTSLAEVRVSRSAAPGARPRRLGREFANKLRTVLSANGTVLLE